MFWHETLEKYVWKYYTTLQQISVDVTDVFPLTQRFHHSQCVDVPSARYECLETTKIISLR